MIELSDEARALIRRVGTADGPSHLARARVKRRIVATLAGAGVAIGSGGTLAAGAPVVAGAAAKMTMGSVALWLAVGAGLGAAVSAPALVSAYRSPVPAVSSATAAGPTVVRPAEGTLPASDAPSPPPKTEPALPPAVPRRAPERTTGANAVLERAPAEPPRGASSLADETRLLEAAQRELARKNTAAALALLDEHARRFPGGALSEERAAARVLALCDLGRTAEAQRAAEAFVRSSPRSPLVPRLQGSCARSEPGSDGQE